MRALAGDYLSVAADDRVFAHLHQAVLGFDGDEIWGKELDRLDDGEVDVQCPACDEELLVDLLSEDSEIEPGLSCETAERICATAVRAKRPYVAAGLTRLFGRTICPNCGTRFHPAGHTTGITHR